MRRLHYLLLVGALAILAGLVGCQSEGTSTENPCAAAGFYCGEGFYCDEDNATCVCENDEACGEGYQCGSTGECLCISDDCCPEHYSFDPDTFSCVCLADSCCPDGLTFDPALSSCRCADADCCPQDHTLDLATFICLCAADSCCPEDTVYDAGLGQCTCTSDSCCPEGFTLDPVQNVCACEGVDCCPVGYAYDVDSTRCRCDPVADCGDYSTCDPTDGNCKCTSDLACATGEFCNPVGLCQASTGCTGSAECSADQICAADINICIDDPCASDGDCEPGTYCVAGQCAPGCNDNGDCLMAEACIDNVCRGDVCDRDSQCGIGESCQAGACVQSAGDYCADCSEFVTCNEGSSCLQHIVEGNEQNFCGPTCDAGNPCPNGYYCGEVYAPCEPSTGICFFLTFNPDVTCVMFDVLGEPDPVGYCAAGDPPEPYSIESRCGPLFGDCAQQPASGQTTRAAEGESCTGLCQDGLVCADVGAGATCYRPCTIVEDCSGTETCEPLPAREGGVCVD